MHISAIKDSLTLLMLRVQKEGVQKHIYVELLEDNENGLRVLLALTGLANESLKRIITLARIVRNPKLNKLLYLSKWVDKGSNDIVEWGDKKIEALIKNNSYFRKGLVNLFFEGRTVPFLGETLPAFEFNKLGPDKLSLSPESLFDTIARYKEKGSYSGKAGNNPELVIAATLKKLSISYEKGDLTELIVSEPIAKRTMDFIVPHKQQPRIIIESSFLSTTSSGQGDKSKTESNIRKLIAKYYPEATFIGFVDGIGWYVRKSDLKRMVQSYDDVFTFHKSEIRRFISFLKSELQ